MDRADQKRCLHVEVCESIPLQQQEKAVFAPYLEKQKLSPDFLDIITNIPNRSCIIKVWSENKELLGLTTVLLTPTIFMKHCFGQGNHIGTNNTFFFSENADKTDVLTAIFKKLLEIRPIGGLYIGLIDDDLSQEFKQALNGINYHIAGKVMEAGSIDTQNHNSAKMLRDNHNHLSRQINRFHNKGGKITIHEGTVHGELADAFVKCCKTSYLRNPHPGAPINVEVYGKHIRDFLQNYPSALYVYATLKGAIVGVQMFIKHKRHLELTEGGFLADNCHAYENIIVASVQYAVQHNLDRVSYGLILNQTKERLLDKVNRKPIYMITMGTGEGHPGNAGHMDPKAQFPSLYWKERSDYPYSLI